MIDREGHVGAAAKGRRGHVVIVVDAGVGGGVVGGGVHSSELANIMTV